MATERFYLCNSGHKEWPMHLFDALKDCAEGKIRHCGNCQMPMQLQLVFDFGLNAGRHAARVLDAFIAETEPWESEERAEVRFYPFLVMVEAIEAGYRSVWLPYWHTVSHKDGRLERKYGQWAPFMGEPAFANLLRQTRTKGYKLRGSA